MERIGIFGGTYNPPHLGHTQAADYAWKALGLKKLYMIPSYISPHKEIPQGSPSPAQRLQMVSLAASHMDVEVSNMELQRGGASYTYQTVLSLREKHPGQELVLLMGTDMFLTVESWKEADLFLPLVTVAVFHRGDRGERAQISAYADHLKGRGIRVEVLQNPVLEISSTQLRRLLIFRSAKPFLAEPVLRYIERSGLYGLDRDYENLPISQLEEVVVSLLKPNRVAHVLGCRDTAVKLAKQWGADEPDAARAALLHDITKALDGPLQLTLCREYGVVLDDFAIQNPKTLHALTGSLVAERIFGENPRVVSAICSHTTGKAKMNTLEKIIYVADYMEPNRAFPGVEKLREAAFTDLDSAMVLGLKMTLDLLKSEGKTISPASVQALADLEGKE